MTSRGGGAQGSVYRNRNTPECIVDSGCSRQISRLDISNISTDLFHRAIDNRKSSNGIRMELN